MSSVSIIHTNVSLSTHLSKHSLQLPSHRVAAGSVASWLGVSLPFHPGLVPTPAGAHVLLTR
jgi:hypothetical protein